jgi:hypothetical protein
MIRAYMDESHDGAGKKAFAIGGCLGSFDEWLILELLWDTAMDGRTFHMTDCESMHGEFSEGKGWNRDTTRELIRTLISIIRGRGILSFGSSVLVEDFKEIFPDERETSLQYLCFQHCIAQLAEWASMYHETVSFVFDQNKDFAPTAHRLFDQLRAVTQWKHADLLGTLVFQSRTTFIGLQVADLIAYESYKYAHNERFRADLPMRKSLNKIVASGKYNLFRWTKPYLIRLRDDIRDLNQQSVIGYLDTKIKETWMGGVPVPDA